MWCLILLAAIHKDLYTFVGCAVEMIACCLLDNCLSLVPCGG